MFKAYHIRWGIIFSLFIALCTGIPWLIRQNIGQYFIFCLLISLRILMCWFIHHYFLLHDFNGLFRRARKLKGVISIAVGMGVVFIFNQRLKWEFYANWPNPAVLTEGQQLYTNLFRSFMMSGASYFVAYYLQVNLQLQRSKLENEYLKQDQLKAQLFSLQQQVSPHFLFNSLSTLRTIAPDQSTKTYVSQLANVYRYLLTFNESQKVTVGTELTFMKSYLYILQERFEEGLRVSIEIGDKYINHYIPPLTLQILVENAIKHNVVAEDRPLLLRIYTDGEGMLVVENSYQPKISAEESHGKGLQNINDRYWLLNAERIIVRQENNFFTVIIPLLLP